MVDQLGDIGRVLDRANREDLAALYEALRLTVDYDHRTRVAEVSMTPAPRVDRGCVPSGGVSPGRTEPVRTVTAIPGVRDLPFRVVPVRRTATVVL
jgi:hypothetical protein